MRQKIYVSSLPRVKNDSDKKPYLTSFFSFFHQLTCALGLLKHEPSNLVLSRSSRTPFRSPKNYQNGVSAQINLWVFGLCPQSGPRTKTLSTGHLFNPQQLTWGPGGPQALSLSFFFVFSRGTIFMLYVIVHYYVRLSLREIFFLLIKNFFIFKIFVWGPRGPQHLNEHSVPSVTYTDCI